MPSGRLLDNVQEEQIFYEQAPHRNIESMDLATQFSRESTHNHRSKLSQLNTAQNLKEHKTSDECMNVGQSEIVSLVI